MPHDTEHTEFNNKRGKLIFGGSSIASVVLKGGLILTKRRVGVTVGANIRKTLFDEVAGGSLFIAPQVITLQS